MGHTPMWVVALVAVVTAIVLLVRASREGEHVTYRVRCPTHGVEATIVVRTLRGGEPRHIERCTLRQPSTRIDCGERCLRRAR